MSDKENIERRIVDYEKVKELVSKDKTVNQLIEQRKMLIESRITIMDTLQWYDIRIDACNKDITRISNRILADYIKEHNE